MTRMTPPKKERRVVSTLSKIDQDTPGEGTHYMTITIYAAVLTLLLGLWKMCLVSTPVFEKYSEMLYFDPYYSSKFGKM